MRNQTASEFTAALTAWFATDARKLPWRDKTASAWHILVSEFMLQQTQVDRVLPRYLEWIERWPTSADLAAASPSDALRAWDRLGYPRRALWLHRAATEIVEQYNGVVPNDVETLESLTGIGPYTARAVAAFAYGDRHPVVDTNTRRVIARAVHGIAAAATPKSQDLQDMEALLPLDRDAAQSTNAAMMELGAVICTARKPLCSACPVAAWCDWRGSGYPDNAPKKPKSQAKFAGSDRQVRGRIMAALRVTEHSITRAEALSAAHDHPRNTSPSELQLQQAIRALDSLIADGLITVVNEQISLPVRNQQIR